MKTWPYFKAQVRIVTLLLLYLAKNIFAQSLEPAFLNKFNLLIRKQISYGLIKTEETAISVPQWCQANWWDDERVSVIFNRMMKQSCSHRSTSRAVCGAPSFPTRIASLESVLVCFCRLKTECSLQGLGHHQRLPVCSWLPVDRTTLSTQTPVWWGVGLSGHDADGDEQRSLNQEGWG